MLVSVHFASSSLCMVMLTERKSRLSNNETDRRLQ